MTPTRAGPPGPSPAADEGARAVRPGRARRRSRLPRSRLAYRGDLLAWTPRPTRPRTGLRPCARWNARVAAWMNWCFHHGGGRLARQTGIRHDPHPPHGVARCLTPSLPLLPACLLPRSRWWSPGARQPPLKDSAAEAGPPPTPATVRRCCPALWCRRIPAAGRGARRRRRRGRGRPGSGCRTAAGRRGGLRARAEWCGAAAGVELGLVAQVGDQAGRAIGDVRAAGPEHQLPGALREQAAEVHLPRAPLGGHGPGTDERKDHRSRRRERVRTRKPRSSVTALSWSHRRPAALQRRTCPPRPPLAAAVIQGRRRGPGLTPEAPKEWCRCEISRPVPCGRCRH
ncbi:hypothetical protein S1361_03955 [Streptomyces cyanogenus]|uniref:Uncharacterized protein n=1 Tax=Streptomyces cyanogenus TaxID=80860 RepID=A0ABX7TIY4_STRCY|nr:hypothetical protein S1361_03955 [Streptomyces cyanogenus]